MLKTIEEKKSRPFQIKATASEKEKMQELADKFTRGNLSAWVRYAALNYSPTAQELSRSTDTQSQHYEEK